MLLCFAIICAPHLNPNNFYLWYIKKCSLLCVPVSSSSRPLSVTPDEEGVSWHFLSLTTSSSSLGCSSSGTGTYLCANTCVPIANLRGFNRTTGKNQNKHTGGEESDGDHGVWVRQALQAPQGMLPLNMPVCNVHPTSQLIPPALWNMADVPNTPFQNL